MRASPKRRARGVVGLAAVVLLLAACDDHDLGQPCPELQANADATSGDGRAETQEVVEQNVAFPCDELICIATSGRDGYCSKKCREDAGCPAGFSCREIQPVGPFAGEKFCAWKSCEKASDCGNKDDFCCVPVPGSGPLEDLKFCDFKSNGKCG